MKTQHQCRDIATSQRLVNKSQSQRASQRRVVPTLRRFRDSCIRIMKSIRDPIFEALSDIRTRSRTGSKRNQRDRENSCLCISLLELSMSYRTMLVITSIMFYF